MEKVRKFVAGKNVSEKYSISSQRHLHVEKFKYKI